MILKERYINICNEYLKRFCDKQEFNFEPNDAWVRGEAGGCANVGDYYFSFEEIRYDIDNDIPKGKIIEWYDYTLETSRLGLSLRIGYSAFCKGAPLPYTKEQIDRAKKLKARLDKAAEEFEKYVKETSDNQG